MATRLAESGYAVLVINPFYRIKKAPTSPDHPDFNDPATRNLLMGQMGSLTPTTAATDAGAFVPWLDKQPAVDPKKKIGTTGYCMGGPYTFRTAAQFPDRVGAIATFHGAALATDKADSPHLLVPKMHASALIAIAANDDKSDPKAKDTLNAAFESAKLPHEVEVYTGTLHGWCPPDTQAYNHDAAEKAWGRLLAVFGKALA
jgi:carboxymethylenebutenolidase